MKYLKTTKLKHNGKCSSVKAFVAICVFKSLYNYCFQFQQESITFSTSFSRNFSSDKLHLVFVMPFLKTGSHFRELRESTKKRKCNISLETFICILKHLLKSFWRSVLFSFVFFVGHSWSQLSHFTVAPASRSSFQRTSQLKSIPNLGHPSDARNLG